MSLDQYVVPAPSWWSIDSKKNNNNVWYNNEETTHVCHREADLEFFGRPELVRFHSTNIVEHQKPNRIVVASSLVCCSIRIWLSKVVRCISRLSRTAYIEMSVCWLILRRLFAVIRNNYTAKISSGSTRCVIFQLPSALVWVVPPAVNNSICILQ